MFATALLLLSTLPLAIVSADTLSAILPLQATRYGTDLVANISIGDSTYQVLADTGSADLWVLGSNWTCHDSSTDAILPRAECQFGNKTYTPSPTFSALSSVWLGERYGDGNAIGPMGFERVQLGEIVIPQQQIGVVNYSSTIGDRVNTGVMGLAFSSIALAHPEGYAPNTSLGLLGETVPYDTVFVSMVQQGVLPYFSFALERLPLGQEKGFGGYLTFGTLPPVAHGDFATTPVEITQAMPASLTNGTRKITEWALSVQAVSWDGKSYDTPFQAVVDTGNWANYFPRGVAAQINAGFSPPGKLVSPTSRFDSSQLFYSVPCSATPPANVSIQTGGKVFAIDARDMIWRDWTGECFSSVAPATPIGDIELPFLGDAFLKNMVAVFDVGKEEMRFAARVDENSSDGSGTVVPASGGSALGRGCCSTVTVMLGVAVVVAASVLFSS